MLVKTHWALDVRFHYPISLLRPYVEESAGHSTMKLIFTKGAGKYDRMQVVRDGLPNESLDCPKQRIIPHDMVHLAVEHSLQARGFLGRVKAGQPATFRMQPEDQSDAVERLVEVFQGDGWSGGGTSAAEMIEMYRVTCDVRACSMLPIDENAIEVVRAVIAKLTTQWEAVAVGESLELEL